MQFETVAQVIYERLQDAGFKHVTVCFERIEGATFAQFWVSSPRLCKMPWQLATDIARHAARGFESYVLGPRVGVPE